MVNSEMYKDIDKVDLENIISKSEKVIIKENVDLDLQFLKDMRVNAVAGLTDYLDHRGDTLEEVMINVNKSLKNRLLQKGNYYNKKGEPFDTLVIKLNYGSWGAYAGWKNGSKSFFRF